MFCLDRRCVYRPSINISKSGGWSRWRRKELSWSLTEGRKRETTDPKDTCVTPPLNQRLYCMLAYYWVVPRRPQLDLIRYGGYEVAETYINTKAFSSFFILLLLKAVRPLTDTISSKMLSKIICQSSCYFCHEKTEEEKPNMLSAQLFSLSNLLTDRFLFLWAPMLWLNLLLNKIRVWLPTRHLIQWSEEWMKVWKIRWSLWSLLLMNLVREETWSHNDISSTHC